MKVFESEEEIEKYFNAEEGTYIFKEDGDLLDIELQFDLDTNYNIHALNIKALDIYAGNISAGDIDALEIKADNISADDIDALEIEADNINASDIKANNMIARNIHALDIIACNINANNISFHAICVAYDTLVCNKIKGRYQNAKYLCLDGEPVIKGGKR